VYLGSIPGSASTSNESRIQLVKVPSGTFFYPRESMNKVLKNSLTRLESAYFPGDKVGAHAYNER